MATATTTSVLRRATLLVRYQQSMTLLGGASAAILTCAVGLAAMLVAAGLSAPTAWRQVLPAVAAIAACAVALIWIWRVLQPPSPSEVAADVERRFPQLRDRFVTAVEIAGDEHATSPSIARELSDQASDAVRELDLRRAIDTRQTRNLVIWTVASCALIAVTTIAFPSAWAEMLHPTPPSLPAPAFTPQSAPRVPAVTGPSIADVSVVLEYPAYTRQAPETRSAAFEDISALVGTRVTVSALVAGEGAVAALVVNDATQDIAIKAEERVEAEFTVRKDVTWRLTASTLSGEAVSTPTHRIRAVADESPRIRLTEPGKSITIPSARPVRLAYRAEDDWGLRGVTLHYREPGADTWTTESLAPAGGRVLTGAWTWDLRPLRLSHGEMISYRLTTRDNDTISGPKRASTAIYTISVGGEQAHLDADGRIDESTEYEADAMETLERKAEELSRQLDEMLARLEEGDMSAEEQSRRSSEMQEAQRRVAEQADRVSRALAESERRMEADKDVPPDVLEKLQEVHDLLQEAMNEELAEALKALEESLKDQNPDRLQQNLQRARQQQEEFEMSLEQVIELLKRARLEQDIARVADEADRLTQQQSELNEAREQAEKQQAHQLEAQAEEQRDAGKREQDLEERLNELRERAQELNDPSASDLGEVAQKLEQSGTQDAMQEAAENLEQGQPQDAAEPQEQALAELQQASNSLQQLQMQMSGEDARQAAQAMAEMTRDALFLSREQERVMESTDEMDALTANSAAQGKDLREAVRREQDAMQAGAGELARKMRALAAQTPAFDPALARMADDAAEVMARAGREASGGAGPQAAASQREAMGRMNELADELIRMAENSQQGGQGNSMQQLMQQLQNMAQQQRGLNQQTQSAQRRPGQSPREQGSQGNLADEQGRLREALQKLLDRAGQESGLPDQLGDVPGEMGDVEQQLREGRLGNETAKRQQDILRRMLDAQRSVYKKDQQRRRRVAERPKPFRLPPSPPELTQRHDPPLGPRATSGDDALLPLDYEDVVKEYFRALAEVTR